MEPYTFRGTVATYARCCGILNNYFTANFLQNAAVKFFENWLRIDGNMVMSLVCSFLAHPVRHREAVYPFVSGSVTSSQ